MADRMEYSRPATSESNAKVGSKELLSNGSFCGNGSADNEDARSKDVRSDR